MKITIKEKRQRKESKISLQDLEPGTIVDLGSVKGLVITTVGDVDKDIVLLTNCNDGWFSASGDWKNAPIKKILGKLTEIIVDPNQE